MLRHRPHRGLIAFLIAILAFSPVLSATEHYGQVGFTGLAVPGATVTATQGDKQIVTTTDQSGLYRFADLAEGTWTIKIEMRGLRAAHARGHCRRWRAGRGVGARAVAVRRDHAAACRRRSVRRAQLRRQQAHERNDSGTRRAWHGHDRASRAGISARGCDRAGAAACCRAAAAAQPAAPPAEPPADANAANDGFLVNGSVNNGAASPFAQFAAFGNNRRRPGALYNAQFGMLANSSAWDAKPYSMTGQQTVAAETTTTCTCRHVPGTAADPARADQRGPNLFLGYQRTNDDNAITQSQRMPTTLERNGDFSQTVDGLGRPVTVNDPLTGQPFPGNTIPRDRISPEAACAARLLPAADSGLAAGAQLSGADPVRQYGRTASSRG